MIITRTGSVADVRLRSVPTVAHRILAHGDSITNGWRNEGTNYVSGALVGLIRSQRGEFAKAEARGLSGNSFNYDFGHVNGFGRTLLEDGPLYVDGWRKQSAATNWLVVFAGTNGIRLQHNTAAAEAGYFETYVAARISAGWNPDNIVVCTMLPAVDPSASPRDDYNALLVSLAATYGYRLARFDLDETIGQDGDAANTTYYGDGLHPTAAGHAIMGQIVFDAMFPEE